MSGHSKWATTKHRKAAVDKTRAKLFAKLIRQVEVAAREGGADTETNPTLAHDVRKGARVVCADGHHRTSDQARLRASSKASVTNRSPTRAMPRQGSPSWSSA